MMQNIKSHFIIFFGPDGAGKTTQVKLLTSYLKSYKFRVRNEHLRVHHTIASLLSKLFIRFGYYKTTNEKILIGANTKIFVPPTFNCIFCFIWALIEFLSVVPLVIVRFYLPLALGYIVIADRFTVDTVISIAYFLNNYHFLRGFITKLLLCFIPKGAILFYLNTDLQTLLKRRNDETLYHIKFQRLAYNQLAKTMKFVHIDTSKHNQRETFMKVIQALSY